MNRFIKSLIIINGLILPTFVGFLCYDYISRFISRTNYEAESILVGEKLEEAKKDSLALQGISYDSPRKIYNSNNFYLPVSVMTYEEARQLEDAVSSAGDIGLSFFNYFNVVFLDKNYQVIGQLLDQKASITDIHINEGQYPYERNKVDQSVNNIAYLIGFTDTNEDGKLNSLDAHDLYISDLDGKNLTQVSRQKEIVDFEFINSNSELFIRFKERNQMRDEYKHIKFGLYTIETGVFKELKGIEEKLLDIQSKLIR